MTRAWWLGAVLVLACGKEEDKGPPPEVPPKTEQGLETFGTSETTKEIFKKEGLEALQKKLNGELGELGAAIDGGVDAGTDAPKNEPPKELEINGTLDVKTQKALGAYQRVHGMPETGLPDYKTLERLGLKPSDVFVHRPPGNRSSRQE